MRSSRATLLWESASLWYSTAEFTGSTLTNFRHKKAQGHKTDFCVFVPFMAINQYEYENPEVFCCPCSLSGFGWLSTRTGLGALQAQHRRKRSQLRLLSRQQTRLGWR